MCAGQGSCAVGGNVLDRTFEASAPNRKWIADFTYVWTAEGWLYVAAVIDLFSRRVRSLKLELAGKLPSLHDTPPAPSKHLTRCLRNRVQAISLAAPGEATVSRSSSAPLLAGGSTGQTAP